MNRISSTVLALATALLGQAQVWLDPDFGTAGIVNTSLNTSYDGAFALERQPDGKLIVAGASGTSANYNILIARYDTNGSVDTDFGTNGVVTLDLGSADQCFGLALAPDGSIVAVGITNGTPSGTDSWIARFTATGDLDLTFNGVGYVRINDSLNEDKLNAVAVRTDGKVLAAGRGFISSKQCFLLAQFNPDGTPDSAFGTDGIYEHLIGIDNCEATCIELQADGGFFCAGTSYTDMTSKNDMVVTKYSANGVLDNTFSTDGKAVVIASNNQDKGYALCIQPDGNVLVGGVENEVSSSARIIVARLSASGTVDTSFGQEGFARPYTGDFPTRCEDIAVLDDGSIVACGTSTPNPQGRNSFLCRWNSAGTLDATFGTAGILEYGTTGQFRETPGMVVQPDGKIVLAGITGVSTNIDVLLLRYLNEPLTSVSELTNSDLRFVSANPNEIRITSTGPIRSMELFDAQGRSLFTGSLPATSGLQIVRTPNALPPGSYMLSVDARALRFVILE